MQQQQQRYRLPIHKYQQEIVSSILANPVTIICGETGSGKTTQLPQFMFTHFRRIMISQPRRISAVTLAERVAEQMGINCGEEVGYCVRFQEKRGLETRVTFMTDGMAIRELMLSHQYDLIILDEAHQRSINTDVLLALLKSSLNQPQSDMNKNQSNLNKTLSKTKSKDNVRHNSLNFAFKLVIMSATIDSAKFMRFFNTNSVVHIQGRSFPTEIYHVWQPVQNYVDAVYNTVMQIHHSEQPGDILAFLTGEDEIISLQKKISQAVKQHNLNLLAFPLYSALSPEAQHQIFHAHSYTQNTQNYEVSIESNIKLRRIILSTNIAETSVTIPGVRYVVDSGFMKIRMHQSGKMMEMLVVVPISKANALQRAGRAGRQAEGKCFRLYGRNEYEQMEQQCIPEILRSELSGPILQLKAIGVPSIEGLAFLDQPDQQTMQKSLSLLREIKCITEEEQLTKYGLEVSKLPLPPLLAHLLLGALDLGCADIMLSMISLACIENLFITGQERKGGKLYEVMSKYLPTANYLSTTKSLPTAKSLPTTQQSTRLITSDHLSKINILHSYLLTSNKALFCKQNFLNKNGIKRAHQIREQLADYVQQISEERKHSSFLMTPLPNLSPPTLSPTNIGLFVQCLQKYAPLSIAQLDRNNKYIINGSQLQASIHPESLCFYLKEKPKVIAFGQVVRTNKIYLKDITPLK